MKNLSNGSSISFASNGYSYSPRDISDIESEKAFDLIFKNTSNRYYRDENDHVIVDRGNQYWLANAIIMTASRQGMVYYCFQYINDESVDYTIVGNSDQKPADGSYSEDDYYVKPIVTLKSEVHVNASGQLEN